VVGWGLKDGDKEAVQSSSRANVKSFQVLSPRSVPLPRCLQVAELKFHVVKFEDVSEIRARVRGYRIIPSFTFCACE
jgi:hypothetical protein